MQVGWGVVQVVPLMQGVVAVVGWEATAADAATTTGRLRVVLLDSVYGTAQRVLHLAAQ